MTRPVPDRLSPRERVVSWRTIWAELHPADSDAGHDDEAAEDMHRLRGLVAGQCAETESVLGMVVQALEPGAAIDGLTAGQLVGKARTLLDDARIAGAEDQLDLISIAV